MECNEASDLLSTYFDGELSRDTAEQVQQHVHQCAKCAEELKSFEQLGSLLVSASTPGPAPELWDRIASRLNEPSTVGLPERSWAPRWQVVTGIAVALAASVLLFLSLRTPVGSHSNHVHGSNEVAVDYRDIVQLYAQKPSEAIHVLSKRFEGQEVSVAEAETLIGYRPSVSNSLPNGMQLVSTRVLKLPKCNCENGKCTCGPTGCNCAASVCKRSDGSEFLVFEHCESQNVSFGDDPSKTAMHGEQKMQLIESDSGLAISWIAEKRRLTAIGLKNSAEAESLMAAVGKNASMN